MAGEYRGKREEEKELVRRFERSSEANEEGYFDLNEYEDIIEYYLQRGLFEQALKAAQHGIDRHPYSYDLVMFKAQALINLDKLDEALEIMLTVKNLMPGDTDMSLMIGTTLSLMGKFDEAVKTLEQILPLVEDPSEIHYQIGMAYQHSGKYLPAIESYKAALENNLDNENALYELAYCLDMVGELENSIDYYKQFIDKDPFLSMLGTISASFTTRSGFSKKRLRPMSMPYS